MKATWSYSCESTYGDDPLIVVFKGEILLKETNEGVMSGSIITTSMSSTYMERTVTKNFKESVLIGGKLNNEKNLEIRGLLPGGLKVLLSGPVKFDAKNHSYHGVGEITDKSDVGKKKCKGAWVAN